VSKTAWGKACFFGKDCDAHRVLGKRIVIIGRNNESADYALATLLFSPSLMIATNGQDPPWDSDRAGWLKEYQVLIRHDRITMVKHDEDSFECCPSKGPPVTSNHRFVLRLEQRVHREAWSRTSLAKIRRSL
jgi:hypothetical protein